jgi:hypothetical protein
LSFFITSSSYSSYLLSLVVSPLFSVKLVEHPLRGFSDPIPEEFPKKSNEIIKSSLSTYKKEMETAARLILDYELMFRDTIYQHVIKT